MLSFVTIFALYFDTPLQILARTIFLFYATAYFAIFIIDADQAGNHSMLPLNIKLPYRTVLLSLPNPVSGGYELLFHEFQKLRSRKNPHRYKIFLLLFILSIASYFIYYQLLGSSIVCSTANYAGAKICEAITYNAYPFWLS